jgi:WD40 repeat protein
MGTLKYTLIGHNDWVLSVVKLNFDLIASASNGKTINVWNVTTGVLKLTFLNSSEWILQLTSLDNHLLAS